MQRFYGEVEGGWWSFPLWKLEAYAAQLGRMQAEEDLRQLHLHWIMSPSANDSEKNAKERAIERLEARAAGSNGQAANRPKGMSTKDIAAQVAMRGLGQVVYGPPIKHGIGTRRINRETGEMEIIEGG